MSDEEYESDIIQEIASDNGEFSDADDDDDDSESEHDDKIDDSLYTFTRHTGELFSVACSPSDNALVATGGRDHKGFLWRIGQGETSELNGHTESVSSLAFSYDGTFLASGCLNGIVQVWDASGKWIGLLKGPGGIEEGPLGGIEEGPLGGIEESPPKDIEEEEGPSEGIEESTPEDIEESPAKDIEEKEGIEWLRWHPTENVLLAGYEDSKVWMWEWDADKLAFEFDKVFVDHDTHDCSVTCGDFTPDGNTICTGYDDATLRIWNRETGEKIHVVQGTKGLTCLSISSTLNVALTGSKDGSVHIVNINTGSVVKTLPSHSRSIECVGFAPSGSWAAVGSMDKKMTIWDIEHWSAWDPKPRSTCKHKDDGVSCLAWLGTWHVATGCVGGVVRIWDSRSGDCVRTFREHSQENEEPPCAIQSLALSANRHHLVSASSDGTARVFEVEEKFRCIGTF